MPLAEIDRRLAELPHDRDIVAYCRCPFCVLSEEAVKLLSASLLPCMLMQHEKCGKQPMKNFGVPRLEHKDESETYRRGALAPIEN